MNRVSLIFLGIFATLAFSFTGLVLTNQLSYGELAPHVDENEGKAFPLGVSGLASRGALVYQDLGCVYCHTQQVRRPGFGSDIARGWGDRQSVAREYIRESHVFLGDQRVGPDVRNVGARLVKDGKDSSWLYAYLYNPEALVPGTTQPSYQFLFETRKVIGQPSPKALKLAHIAVPSGFEVVPTERAETLVAYLLSLSDTYSYPEAKNVFTPGSPKGEGKSQGGHK